MFRVIKQLRSYNQLEYRYLVQHTSGQHYIAVSHSKLSINAAINAIRTEAKGSRKYLLKKYN